MILIKSCGGMGSWRGIGDAGSGSESSTPSRDQNQSGHYLSLPQ